MPLAMEESKAKLKETQLNKKAFEFQDENEIYIRSFYRERPKDINSASHYPHQYESEYHNFDFKYDDNEMEA